MSRASSHELESEHWSPVPAQVDEHYHDGAVDPLHLFIGLVPTLVEVARNAESNADSYRGFHVTASGLMYDSEENRTAIITAANFKAKIPTEDRSENDLEDIPKVCAEMDIINAGEEHGFDTMVGVVVAGTTNKRKIAEVTNRNASTLAPCNDCRDLTEKSPMVHDDTFFLTVGMVRNIWQFYTAKVLRNTYSKPNDEFNDPLVRIYSPLEWSLKQQHYSEKIAADGLIKHIGRQNISRSKPFLKAAKKAISL